MLKSDQYKNGIWSGAFLKMVAVVTMTIDHAAIGLINRLFLKAASGYSGRIPLDELRKIYKVMRGIGRIAFPIYCFLLVEGFLYTRSRAKYCIRLFLFALISEVPFNLCLYGKLRYRSHQNVFFELGAGLIAIWIWDVIDRMRNGTYEGGGALKRAAAAFREHPFVAAAVQAGCAAGIAYLCWYLHFDYRYKGIVLITLLYLLRFDRRIQALGGALFMSVWEMPAIASFFPVVYLYNGKRGFQLKYFFYLYYPVHFLIIYLLAGLLQN